MKQRSVTAESRLLQDQNGFAAAGQRLFTGPQAGLCPAGGKIASGSVRFCYSQDGYSRICRDLPRSNQDRYRFFCTYCTEGNNKIGSG